MPREWGPESYANTHVILRCPVLKKKFFVILVKRKTLFKGTTTMGCVGGERDLAQLLTQQGKVEIYSQRAGWGSVYGKLLR